MDGKRRFVRRTALTYGLTAAGLIDIVERGFFGEAGSLPFNVIFYVLVGIVIGSCTWSSMEAKREDALRKARANTLPQSSQGVSKA